jgi:phospholipid transport system transporter-binding protein
MTNPQLTRTADGDWKLSGELSFDTVTGLRNQFRAEFKSDVPATIDLGSVTRVDSAGVALMVDWLRFAKTHNQSIRFRNIPEQMVSIADLCDVTELFTNNSQ